MITIRDMQPDDRNFILDSWVQSCRHELSFSAAAHVLVEGRCKVAVAEADPSVIVGWALARSKTLEYVYVKKDARRCGIAKELVVALLPIRRAGCTTWPWTRAYAEDRFPP